MSAIKPIGTALDHNPNQEWPGGEEMEAEEPEENELTLDASHIYRLGSRIIPGVTATIETNFGKRPWYSEWHAGRGKAVHLAIHYLVKNQLDWNTVDPRIKPRVEAFQKFLRETNLTVVESELPMFSHRYQFAGTLDLIFDNDFLILGDIKSHIEPIIEIQFGGYSILYEETYKKKIKKACGIELRDNGDYDIKWFSDIRRIQGLFLACLTVANWRNQHYPNKKPEQKTFLDDLPDSASWPEFD